MPIIKSAKKRVRTGRRAAIRNAKTKRSLKASLKTLAKSPSAKSLSAAQSNLDQAVKKGVIHKNKAARLKRRSAAQAKAAGAKPVPKAAPKKPVSKKRAVAKKPAAKK